MASSVIGALRVNLGLNSAQFSSGLKAADSSLGQFGRTVGRTAALIGAALTGAVVAITPKLIGMASEVEETASAFDYLFGAQADSVRRWADQTAKGINRSTYELQRQAVAFQQLFKQTAPTAAAAADLSEKFTLLAQDLASFYNVSEGEALQKLRSGLAGEAEPLRTFGVFLTAAAVESQALEMGLIGVNDELTEQQKVMARAALILKVTTDAQGDAARTSGSFANTMRGLTASLNDLGVKIGSTVLPFARALIEQIRLGVQRFYEMEAPVNIIRATLEGLTRAIVLVYDNMGTLIRVAGVFLGMQLAGTAVSLGLAFIKFARGIQAAGFVLAGFHAIQNLSRRGLLLMAGVIALATGQLDKLRGALEGVWDRVKNILPEDATEMLRGALARLGLDTRALEVELSSLGIVTDSTTASIAALDTALGAAGESATGKLKKGLDEAERATQQVASTIQSSFMSAYDSAVEGTFKFRDALAGLFKDLARLAANRFFSMLLGGIGGGGAGGGGGGGGGIGGLIGGIFAGKFANGGSFTVPGTGGTDSQLVSLMATPGENIAVSRGGGAEGGGVVIHQNNAFNNVDPSLRPWVLQQMDKARRQAVAEAVAAVGMRNYAMGRPA